MHFRIKPTVFIKQINTKGILQKRNPALMRGANVRQFGKVLCHIGAKKSRSNMGSVYEVVYAGRLVKPVAEVETAELKQVE